MRTLPSGILIGRRLMMRLKMPLDFSSGEGSFSADTPHDPRIFSGRILHDSSGALEQVEVIYEADLEDFSAVMAAYLDDLAMGSDSVAEHPVDLEAVQRTRGAELKLLRSVCLGSGRWIFLVIACLMV
jgi:hypothetical protein